MLTSSNYSIWVSTEQTKSFALQTGVHRLRSGPVVDLCKEIPYEELNALQVRGTQSALSAGASRISHLETE